MAPRIPSGNFTGDAGCTPCLRLAAALKVGHVPRPVLMPAGILAKASRGVRTVVLSGRFPDRWSRRRRRSPPASLAVTGRRPSDGRGWAGVCGRLGRGGRNICCARWGDAGDDGGFGRVAEFGGAAKRRRAHDGGARLGTPCSHARPSSSGMTRGSGDDRATQGAWACLWRDAPFCTGSRSPGRSSGHARG